MASAKASSMPLFQSTPLPTGRSDNPPQSNPIITEVSIHAPPNRKERHLVQWGQCSTRQFQSTPLPTGRSDCAPVYNYGPHTLFQSTPLPTGRSDLDTALLRSSGFSFQSTPLPTGRSD